MSTSLNTYKEDSIEALLELVRGGLKELFVRCKQRNVAPPLYGKTVYAPPESQGDEGDPEFRFDFGFSPLGILAEYLHKHDPKTIAGVQANREQVYMRLRQWGEHAKLRDEVQRALRDTFTLRQPGVLGPFVLYTSTGDIAVWCRALRMGMVVVQVSRSREFGELTYSNEVRVEQPHGQSLFFPIRSLTPGTTYYVRAFVRSETVQAEVLESACTAFTLAGSEEDQREGHPMSIRVLSAGTLSKSLPSTTGMGASQTPSLLCLLGQPFSTQCPMQSYMRNPAYRSDGLLRRSAICIAWADNTAGCDTDFKAEEVIYKQHQRDQHRYERKKAKHGAKAAAESLQPPVLQLPLLSVSLAQAVEYLPLGPLSSDTVRTINQHVRLGAAIDVFALDMRAGYVGREQLKWLYSVLRRSNAIWKIVACERSIALEATKTAEEQPSTARSDHAETEEEADKNAQNSEKKITSLPALLEHLQGHYADRYSGPRGGDSEVSETWLPTGIVLVTSAPNRWCASSYDPLHLGWSICMEICVSDPVQTITRLQPTAGVTVFAEGATDSDCGMATYANIQSAPDNSLSVEIVGGGDSGDRDSQLLFRASIPSRWRESEK